MVSRLAGCRADKLQKKSARSTRQKKDDARFVPLTRLSSAEVFCVKGESYTQLTWTKQIWCRDVVYSSAVLGTSTAVQAACCYCPRPACSHHAWYRRRMAPGLSAAAAARVIGISLRTPRCFYVTERGHQWRQVRSDRYHCCCYCCCCCGLRKWHIWWRRIASWDSPRHDAAAKPTLRRLHLAAWLSLRPYEQRRLAPSSRSRDAAPARRVYGRR